MNYVKKHTLRKFSNELEKLAGADFNTFRYLLAVSGGHDSMAMATMFIQLQMDVSIVHCNFSLRGSESDEDDAFVRNYFEELGIEVYSEKMPALDYSIQNKLSIQEAARTLRYEYFDQIKKENLFDFIVTAHHKDDSIETFIINLSRGSGINGLAGIPAKTATIIRPLLGFSRDELSIWNKSMTVPFREDSSNAGDKYTRNKIRHHIIPYLNQEIPGMAKGLTRSVDLIGKYAAYLDIRLSQMEKSVLLFHKYGFNIELSKIEDEAIKPFLIHHILSKYDFSSKAIEDMVQAFSVHKSGMKFYSKSGFLAVTDRQKIVVLLNKIETDEFTHNLMNGEFEWHESKIKVTTVPFEHSQGNLTLYLPKSLDNQKLMWRYWKEGDFIKPMGLEYGKQKLQDVFTNAHLDYLEKRIHPILEVNGQIIWIPGLRRSKFHSVNENEACYKITLMKSGQNEK